MKRLGALIIFFWPSAGLADSSACVSQATNDCAIYLLGIGQLGSPSGISVCTTWVASACFGDYDDLTVVATLGVQALNQCKAEKSNLEGQLFSCNTDFSALYAISSNAVNSANSLKKEKSKLNSLISKLRKKCGRGCKSIK